MKNFSAFIKNSLQLLVFISILLLFRSLFFEPFFIPSGSMKNTLLAGDYIFVSKYSYGYSRYSFPFAPNMITAKPRLFYTAPERGDVVVFRGPFSTGTNYIKRIIGLPGDRVQLKNGVLYINDKEVKRLKIQNTTIKQNNEEIRVAEYLEKLENVEYNILQENTEDYINNTGIFHVPSNHFFAMGDNRDNSTDSRFLTSIGFIPIENLVGKAQRVLISFSSTKWFIPKIRLNRLWYKIQPHSIKHNTGYASDTIH